MEIDLTTFVLEIINFLVLAWLLAHFLYRPVLRVIEQRKATIAEQLAEAKDRDDTAQDMVKQYETRLSDWREERERSRAALAVELRQERQRALKDMQEEVELERARARAAQEGWSRQQQQELEAAALRQAGVFASRLLERLASPALDASLLELTVEDLIALAPDRRAALCEQLREAPGEPVQVRSARELPADAQAQLTAIFRELCGEEISLTFVTDASLVAGMRITAGPWTLRANLAEELQAFCHVNGYAA